MGNNSKATAKNKVSAAWLAVCAGMRALDSRVTIKPRTATEIFVIDDEVKDGIHFDIRPIVLTVPPKIASKSNRCLYVVIKGTIVFEPTQRDGQFKTSSFATNIGYFRETQNTCEHVYGAHFDFTPGSVAHPVFHSQMATHADLFQKVQEHHHNVMELQLDADRMERVLGNVRLPTAQMDFFAVLLQVCSDHLINETSRNTKHSEYEKLIEASSFFRGYGRGHPGLQKSADTQCHRSPHWYHHP